MQFLVTGYDGTDEGALERRMAVREEHIRQGDLMRDRGELLYAVAILDDRGKMIGSVCVVDLPSRKEVDAWLKVEPYVVGKVWERIEVRPCRVGPSFVKTKMLVGTWRLVSCEHRLKNGGVLHPLGRDAIGQLIYSADGYMSVVLMRAGRALFKTPGLFEGTIAEKAAAAEGCVSYSGAFEVESDDRVVHTVAASLFPNWVGTKQERFYRFEGGRLLLFTQPFVMGGEEQTAYLVWEKISG